jgi:hypothetical protein
MVEKVPIRIIKHKKKTAVKKILPAVIILVSIFCIFAIVKAATSLVIPTRNGTTGTMHTLSDIYQKLGDSTTAISSHTLAPTDVPTPTMTTISDISSAIPPANQICSGTLGGTANCHTNLVFCANSNNNSSYCDTSLGYVCSDVTNLCEKSCSHNSDCSSPKAYCDTQDGFCTNGSTGEGCGADTDCSSGTCGTDNTCQ